MTCEGRFMSARDLSRECLASRPFDSIIDSRGPAYAGPYRPGAVRVEAES